MSLDQLKLLEEYFIVNHLTNSLASFRAEVLSKYPTKPSQQLLSLLAAPTARTQPEPIGVRQKKNEINMKKTKGSVYEGLLNKMIYSPKLIEDFSFNDKVLGLMGNKIFENTMAKLFPASKEKSELSFESSNQMTPTTSQLPIRPLQSLMSRVSFQENSEHSSEQLNEQLSNEEQEWTTNAKQFYEEYVFDETRLMIGCAKLTKEYGYPANAMDNNHEKPILNNARKESRKFSDSVVFPKPDDKEFPIKLGDITYEAFKIEVIYEREKTGYEQAKELALKEGDVLAGKYIVKQILGSGVFARVLRVKDKSTNEDTCFKMISNNKDFFDQAMDEIKLLRFIKVNCDPSKQHLLNFKSVFYHREHLFIETELLKENLFSAYSKNPNLFTLPTIKIVARQILEALVTLHRLKIIHSDLKPENILIKTYAPMSVVIIDLGNACFLHDNLGGYVQSRSYRAPEVVLGIDYDEKIDIWSVGCILSELWTKNVLFANSRIQGMLVRIQGIMGPWPAWMLQHGRNVANYFSKENLIYFEEEGQYHIILPLQTSLAERTRIKDEKFLDFLSKMLEVDPTKRISAEEALRHPFLAE